MYNILKIEWGGKKAQNAIPTHQISLCDMEESQRSMGQRNTMFLGKLWCHMYNQLEEILEARCSVQKSS
jgi:hypothetical protein